MESTPLTRCTHAMRPRPCSYRGALPTHSSRPITYRPPIGEARYRRCSWKRQALEIDISDPDTWLAIGTPVTLMRDAMGVSVAVAAIGLGVGIGFPVFMVSRDKLDEERLEALRELNKETYEATGEYLSKDELSKLRSPRWTDKREFKDDD